MSTNCQFTVGTCRSTFCLVCQITIINVEVFSIWCNSGFEVKWVRVSMLAPGHIMYQCNSIQWMFYCFFKYTVICSLLKFITQPSLVYCTLLMISWHTGDESMCMPNVFSRASTGIQARHPKSNYSLCPQNLKEIRSDSKVYFSICYHICFINLLSKSKVFTWGIITTIDSSVTKWNECGCIWINLH